MNLKFLGLVPALSTITPLSYAKCIEPTALTAPTPPPIEAKPITPSCKHSEDGCAPEIMKDYKDKQKTYFELFMVYNVEVTEYISAVDVYKEDAYNYLDCVAKTRW